MGGTSTLTSTVSVTELDTISTSSGSTTGTDTNHDTSYTITASSGDTRATVDFNDIKRLHLVIFDHPIMRAQIFHLGFRLQRAYQAGLSLVRVQEMEPKNEISDALVNMERTLLSYRLKELEGELVREGQSRRTSLFRSTGLLAT